MNLVDYLRQNTGPFIACESPDNESYETVKSRCIERAKAGRHYASGHMSPETANLLKQEGIDIYNDIKGTNSYWLSWKEKDE